MKKILFVCLGNICRSPMGEGAMAHLLQKRGISHLYEVDSAGTSGFHQGERADQRMRNTAMAHGVELTSRARQVLPQDFLRFDLIVAMDRQNYKDLYQLATKHGHPTAHICLLRDYDDLEPGANVPDPYYGGMEGFEEVYQIVMRSCETMIQRAPLFQ